MTAAIFHTRTALSEAGTTRQRGFFARLLDAMVEARLRAAVRELNRHRHLVPRDLLKTSGYTASLNDDSQFPFTR